MVFRSIVSVVPALLLAMVGCESQRESAWIIASFRGADGTPIEMAFNNPAVPDMTLEECESSLPDATEMVVAAAREMEPARLDSAQFSSVRCVWSVDDPLKPR